MKYQFQIDGRAFGNQIRNTWKEAAQDAVSQGFAVWYNRGIKWGEQGGSILRIEEPKPNNVMVYVGGSKTSFRCTCGCNVFTPCGDHKYRCNSCETIYTA